MLVVSNDKLNLLSLKFITRLKSEIKTIRLMTDLELT